MGGGGGHSYTETVFCVSGCLVTVKAHQLFFHEYGTTRREEEKRKIEAPRTLLAVQFFLKITCVQRKIWNQLPFRTNFHFGDTKVFLIAYLVVCRYHLV